MEMMWEVPETISQDEADSLESLDLGPEKGWKASCK